MDHTATYDPVDNKLRLYPACRLDKDLYDRLRAAGFKWAPKQELFVAPMWTPDRADLLIELCGEIGDEDTTLVDRAEARADRFSDYSESRANDAEAAHKAVHAIADNIPLGQPILIGHHSEKHARKHAQQIENGMRKAVQMWDTAQYWKQRAAGAVRAAKYKERPDVRARRIKGLEADKRKQEKSLAENEKWLEAWSFPGLTLENAQRIANACYFQMPRKEGDRPDFSGCPTAYNCLNPHEEQTLYAPRSLEEVIAVALEKFPEWIERSQRWIDHYTNRIAYEKAMLGEQGGTATDKVGPEKGGACQCWVSRRGQWSIIQKVNKVSVTLLDNWGNGGKNFTRTVPFDKLTQLMTKAEVDKAREEGRLVAEDELGFGLLSSIPVEKPEVQPKEAPADHPAYEKFKGLREQIKNGVQVVSVPQLFPTPFSLASRMIEVAKIHVGDRILEPSAGTGAIIQCLPGLLPFPNDCRQTIGHVCAVESHAGLADNLRRSGLASSVRCTDFLSLTPLDLGKFDVILMNPPFADGQDIEHIKHAVDFLKPGGRLVAICANGPRQSNKLQPIIDDMGGSWTPLPVDTFKESGTRVNTVIISLTKPSVGLSHDFIFFDESAEIPKDLFDNLLTASRS